MHKPAASSAKPASSICDLPNVYNFWISGKRVRLMHASAISEFYRVPAWSPYGEHLAMFANTDFTGFDHMEWFRKGFQHEASTSHHRRSE